MTELIDLFLGELPKRVELVAEAWQARELSKLQRLAHQLRGSSAGYGFPAIGSAAGRVEDAIRGHAPEQVQLEKLAVDVKELVSLCYRVAPMPPTHRAA